MIPWCTRAANSAGATATGQIATPKTHTRLDKKAKLLKQKDMQDVKAGPVLAQNKFVVTHQEEPLSDSLRSGDWNSKSKQERVCFVIHVKNF